MKRSIAAEDRAAHEQHPGVLFSLAFAITGMALILGVLSVALLLHRLLDPIAHAVWGG